MGRALRCAHFGLGPIGQAIARLALETPGITIVSAADLSPDRAGKDLGEVLGLPRRLRIRVRDDMDRRLSKLRADVAILATSSSLSECKELLIKLIKKGLHVVTTCEELAYPIPGNQAAFKTLDREARAKKVTLLSTGVNPGFAMDALPLMLTAPCSEVRRISATRVVDLAARRRSLQRKAGAGLSVHQFRRALAEGNVRHVGLLQSTHMIAHTLGWKLDRIDETIEPVIAPRDLDTEQIRVPAGAVSGIKQYARAYRKGELIVSLDLQLYVGAEAPRDHILVDGAPPLDVTIAGGIGGDAATAAIAMNCLPKLLVARPGVRTINEISLLHRMNPSEMAAAMKRGGKYVT
ncbi:MAG: dihydrodipicolinate reductase [Vicinamibacteria bacterium]|nr:dihydrodipicolinate reductase [Vicinamibacteria bacterium]